MRRKSEKKQGCQNNKKYVVNSTLNRNRVRILKRPDSCSVSRSPKNPLKF